jgi:hypothetical protein
MGKVIGNPHLTHAKAAVVLTVAYDANGGRASKTFTGPGAALQARSFYARQFKAGNNPQLTSGAGK